MMTLQRAGVPAGMVSSVPELIEDRHLAARGFLSRDIPDQWLGKVSVGGIQVRLSETPGAITSPAPYMGQHNDYVFGKLLGLSKAEIQRYMEMGVIEVKLPGQYQIPPNMAALLPKKQ